MKDQKKSKNKRKKWLRRRHVVVRNVLAATLGVYTRLKYKVKVERFREQEKRPYLILYNHQTAFDQFFIGMAFRGAVYYVATEDIFTKGWVSKLIKFLVNPIPIKKQSADVSAVMNCIRVSREGGTIAIAPEGNRTFGGSTGYMNDAIIPLARKLGMPIALFRIEGGYGVHPRWSDVVRGGGMKAGVTRVISPDEAREMTDAELFAAIKDGLSVVEGRGEKPYPHKKRAEYLERAIYVCPVCRDMSEMHSEREKITCTRCHTDFTVNADMTVTAATPLPFSSVGEWYDWQCDYVNSIDPRTITGPLHEATAKLSEVIPYKNRIIINKHARIALYADRIEAGDLTFDFEHTSVVTVLGRNKLNIYHGGRVYQLKSDKRFNALRYMNIFYRTQNLNKEKNNDGFIGI